MSCKFSSLADECEFKLYIDGIEQLLARDMLQSDMSLVYLDRQNQLLFVYRDILAKRSLILQYQ